MKTVLFKIRVVLYTIIVVACTAMLSVVDSSSENSLVNLDGKAPLSELIRIAYQNNPTISAARETWRAEVENYRLKTSYPDPSLMVTWFTRPIETKLGPQDWNVNLSQAIPFPGKLSKVGELVQADTLIARLNLDKAVRNVTLSILESYHELQYIRAAKDAASKNAKLLDHLRKVGETAYSGNRASFSDVIKAQSQSAQIRYDLLLLEELELTEIVKINGLLNRSPDSLIGRLDDKKAMPVIYTIEEIYRLAEKNREEIRIAQAMVNKASSDIDLAKYGYLPDFKIGVFYASIGDPDVANPPADAGEDAIGLQAGMSIPMWFGKNRSRTSLAKAKIKRAKALKNNRVIETRTSVRKLFFRLQNAQRLISLYRDDMLPRALKSMDLAETWFREGAGSFSDFIETQSVYYNFRLSLARSRADYGKYLARLERMAGVSLTEKYRKSSKPYRKEKK